MTREDLYFFSDTLTPLSEAEIEDLRRREEAILIPEFPSFQSPVTWVAIAVVGMAVVGVSELFARGIWL